MGERASRTRQFLLAHPICCFCGGGTPAETRDHLPARAFFDGRHGPEGYEFPACHRCNGTTSSLESIAAMLANIHPTDETEARIANFLKLAAGVRNNFPDAFAAMNQVSAAEAKRLVRERNIPLPDGMLPSELPILYVKHPDILKAMDAFTGKLLMALYYMHSRSILPHDGAVAYQWFTNAQAPLRGVERVFHLLKGEPQIKRQKASLKDQFDYRYAFEPDMHTAAFFVTFGSSFAILGIAACNGDPARFHPQVRIVLPFQHAAIANA